MWQAPASLYSLPMAYLDQNCCDASIRFRIDSLAHLRQTSAADVGNQNILLHCSIFVVSFGCGVSPPPPLESRPQAGAAPKSATGFFFEFFRRGLL